MCIGTTMLQISNNFQKSDKSVKIGKRDPNVLDAIAP